MSRVVSWLLNAFYLAVLVVCAPLIVWTAIRTGKYREGYREKFLGLVPRRDGDGICVWIHAVSVGEVNLLATILREMRAEHPDWKIVVSTTSRTGHQLARQKYSDLTVFYCPLDFSWAVQRAMQRVRPNLLVLAELELWPNLILAAKGQGVRVAIVNGRMSDKSFPGYRRIRWLVAALLQQLDLIAAQNDESAERFRVLGAPAKRVHVTGSLKYDGAQTERDNPRTLELRKLADFADDDIVFVAGSTQEPEEQFAVDIFRRLAQEHPRLRLVLVPRHPERFDAVANLLEASGLPWTRRTELCGQPPRGTRFPGRPGVIRRGTLSAIQPPAKPGAVAPVLLVDTVGELGAWWGTASIAFVGGSFGSRGGQNMIEPAAYGAAVSFGPHTRNFRDIVTALLEAEAAVVVHDAAEFEAFVRRALEDPSWSKTLGTRAKAFVRSQLGATTRTLNLLDKLTEPTPTAHQNRPAA